MPSHPVDHGTAPPGDDFKMSATQDVVMQRHEASLESLNMRIARLSIALGLELDTLVGMHTALDLHLPRDTREHQFAEELQALLTLRFQMEKQLVEEMGEVALTRIVNEVEQHMERIGFRPGMDGMQVDAIAA